MRVTQEAYEHWHRETIALGEHPLLIRQLRRRFGDAVTSAVEQRVAGASAEHIEAWADRGLVAATRAELFAD